MEVVRRGDSISVTGKVQEWQSFQQSATTRIANVQYPVTIHSSNNTVPSPVNLTTGTFGPWVANAEPYEGMLVRFTNVVVMDTFPYFADPTQYEVDDGTGPVMVHRDGKNTYNPTIGDSIRWIVGLIHYSVNRFKFVPRTDTDFGPIITSVPSRPVDPRPSSFALMQNYPNPFNPFVTIIYQVPVESFIALKVYDVLGREIGTLVSERRTPGTYSVAFNAAGLASGVYFYRMSAGSFEGTKKMLLVR